MTPRFQDITVLPPPPPWSDPFAHPEYYDGVLIRRVLAYGIDVVILAILGMAVWFGMSLLGLLTLGLTMPLVIPVIVLLPLIYSATSLVGRYSATPGMRTAGIRVMSLAPAAANGKVILAQALIHTVVFYGSAGITFCLILLMSLFNARRRGLHDWLAGVVVVKMTRPPSWQDREGRPI